MFAVALYASPAVHVAHSLAAALLPAIVLLVYASAPRPAWRTKHPRAARTVTALLIAVTLAAVGHAQSLTNHAVIIMDYCRDYGIGDWQYWALSCWLRPYYPF